MPFKRLDVHLCWNAACRDPLADKSSLDPQLQQSQHRELSSDAKLAHNNQLRTNIQYATHRYLPSKCPHVSKGNPSHQPHLIPAWKLSPSNAIDEWANADHYIRVHVVPLVVATNDLAQKAVLLVEKTYDYFAQHFGTINR